ncbi:MAG: hypothetical protein ABIM62_06645 [candidate division WOR-3 bacterium]
MTALMVIGMICAVCLIEYIRTKKSKQKELILVKSRENFLRGRISPAEFEIPRGFFFSPNHLWLKILPCGDVEIGMDDFTQKIIGKFDKIEIKNKKRVKKGEDLFTVYQNNKKLTFYSPVEGRISEINKEILENPELLRNSIYEKGWILKITPFELQDLIRETNIDKNAYKWFLKEIEKLEDFLTSHNISNKPAFSTLQDGKIKIEGLLENFDDFAWMDFEEKFLKRR